MRIALGIEYDGANYFGWQRQKEVNSVQEELEKALSNIANHPVTVNCAGTNRCRCSRYWTSCSF